MGNTFYRLEKRPGAVDLAKIKFKKPLILVAGSEGGGIKMDIAGQSVFVNHNPKSESLNVDQAVAVVLYNLRAGGLSIDSYQIICHNITTFVKLTKVDKFC